MRNIAVSSFHRPGVLLPEPFVFVSRYQADEKDDVSATETGVCHCSNTQRRSVCAHWQIRALMPWKLARCANMSGSGIHISREFEWHGPATSYHLGFGVTPDS